MNNHYIFALVEPAVDAKVVEGVDARKHTAKVAIVKLLLADGATIYNNLNDHDDVPFRDHVDINEVDQIIFKF